MNYELTGTLHEVMNEQQVRPTLRKREFVLMCAEKPEYPQYIKLELVNDRCDLGDSYKVGDEITVSFNLKGRPWTNPKGEKVYFTTLEAWRIARGGAQPKAAAPQPQGDRSGGKKAAGFAPGQQPAASAPAFGEEEQGFDDLPF